MSIRVTKNLALKDRSNYTFNNFKGVDFSTSPYLVAKNRAISAQNLIYENGTVRKRTGWKSLCNLPGKVNGLFSFELENTNIVLAYAGTKFYLLKWNEKRQKYDYKDITQTSSYDVSKVDESRLVERRIQLYVNKNKAYIIGCGDYLVFGKWGADFELRRVFNNEDTYIPTTTINIDNDEVNDDLSRVELDDVNILSSFRKNEFVGVDKESATWTVDTAIMGVENAIDNGTLVSIELHTLDENNNSIVKNISGSTGSLYYTHDDQTDLVGSVDYAKGKITLNINTKPQETNTSNIIVTFSKTEEVNKDVITNATISCLFGGGGLSNRLFLSGTETHKNVHVWSEMYDYTYFSTNNYDQIGSDSSEIMGYVRATDGTLLVFKEKNGSDATIYYVTGEDIQDEDYLGNPVFLTKFYKVAGNVTDTIYGKYATASLNGDNLILTRNGVKGLELYENLSTSSYRIRERSRMVNAKLLEQPGLKDSCGFVYKDKYYLSVDDVVYVSDSRFTFQAEEDISDSFNYEWWYFTNVDAHVWCEIDNELYFGTKSGMVCKFTKDEYADITYQDTEDGEISIDYINSTISYNLELKNPLNSSSNITLRSEGGDIYSLFLDVHEMISLDDEGYIYFDESILDKIYEGIEFYVDRVDGTGLEINKKYHIDLVDLDKLNFAIFNEDFEQVKPISLGFRMCKKINGIPLYLENIDNENQEFQVKQFINGEVVKLIMYNYTTIESLKATIQYKENVVACWYTPICDLGSNMFSKTLLGITVTTEPLVKGAISVGYQTRNIEKDFMTYGNRGFNFGDINFADFSFESSFTNSNTIRVKERNFNFIILRYVSDNQSSCAVNGITIRYKINRLNKGVR